MTYCYIKNIKCKYAGIITYSGYKMFNEKEGKHIKTICYRKGGWVNCNKNIKIMSKKTFNLVTGIIGAVQAAAVAIVTYTEPSYATAINSAIVIAGTAAIEICNLFVKE